MTIDAKWQCRRCLLVYHEEADAIDCCSPGIARVYLCPVCQKPHKSAPKAESCCLATSSGLVIDSSGLSHEDLERLGQARLPL